MNPSQPRGFLGCMRRAFSAGRNNEGGRKSPFGFAYSRDAAAASSTMMALACMRSAEAGRLGLILPLTRV